MLGSAAYPDIEGRDTMQTNRDYALLGRDAKLAEDIGLISAEWYHSDEIGRAHV